MTVETLQNLSLTTFIAAGVFFLVAVFLFFSLRIRSVIGYLTGSSRRRAVEQIVLRSEKGVVSQGRQYSYAQDLAATTVLPQAPPEATTMILSDLENRTETLISEEVTQFVVEDELLFTESKEVIE